MTRVADLFVEAGVLAHDAGELPDALAELAVRLDLAGAGDLLDALTRTCWTPDEVCPSCGHRQTPRPHPKPTPPPTPPPPPPPAS